MTYKTMLSICLLISVLTAGGAQAEQNRLLHLQTYRQMGIDRFDAVKGKQLWYASVNARSCTSCHGDNPGDPGKHVTTGKVIAPMSISVNSERYRDGRKIEKWFLRNCKWTFGRECNTQEKADILTWLSSQ